MLQATRTFLTSQDGSEVRVVAGRTRVIEGHELAIRFPDSFEPIPGERKGARDAVRAGGSVAVVDRRSKQRSGSKGIEPWRIAGSSQNCFVLQEHGRTRTRLTTPAKRRIEALIEKTTQRDGLEVGGLLFGIADRDLVQVFGVAEHGPNAVREADGYRPDWDYDLAQVDQARAAGLEVVGAYHTHREWRAPSLADLEFWTTLRRGLGLEYMLGLLALPSRTGVEYEAYVIRGGFGERDFCSRSLH